MNKKIINYLFLAGFGCVVLAVLLLSLNGYWVGDDYSMRMNQHGERIATLGQLFSMLWWRYMNWGAGFATFFQLLFCGVLAEHRWVFEVANAVVFALFCYTCTLLVSQKSRHRALLLVAFALLFWFLVPQGDETLFWLTGSTAYLWNNACVFLFLLLYCRYRDGNGSWWAKCLLAVLAVLLAQGTIGCVSVCGAFVVYYLPRLKQLRGNALPLVIGFVIGTVIGLIAPGNYVRAAQDFRMTNPQTHLNLFLHPLDELAHYRALWLLAVAVVAALIVDRAALRRWLKAGSLLLVALSWSFVAFSIVFVPFPRALFFGEALAVVLTLRLVAAVFWPLMAVRRAAPWLVGVVFAAFVADAHHALADTRVKHQLDTQYLARLKAEGGSAALNDSSIKTHRLALRQGYPDWAWCGMADRLGIDSVEVLPDYCDETYWREAVQSGPAQYVLRPNHHEGIGVVIVRLRCENECGIEAVARYQRPHNLLHTVREKTFGYRYDRSFTIQQSEPEFARDGWCYYRFFASQSTTKNITEITIYSI